MLAGCAVLRVRGESSLDGSGGYGEGETPLPFPNRVVKPLSADGTWPSRAWESRTLPVFIDKSRPWGRLFVVGGRPSGRLRDGGRPSGRLRDLEVDVHGVRMRSVPGGDVLQALRAVDDPEPGLGERLLGVD